MTTSLFIHSFIHSFIQTISIEPFQVHYYSLELPIQHGYCVGLSEFHAEAPQITASEGLEGLVQGQH